MVGTVQNKIKQAQSAKLNPVASQGTLTSQNKTQQIKPVELKPRKTKFSYYAVLPTLDVPVGSSKPIDTSLQVEGKISRNSQKIEKVTIANVEPVKEVQQQRNIEKEGDFLLQVASYKKKSRANLTRGRLSKKGIDAYIQEKKIKGHLWYRVVAGPVDQNSVTSWKNSAEKMGHRPLVISLR
jgi:cell division protein FtsN